MLKKKGPSQGQWHTYNKTNWEFDLVAPGGGPSAAVNVKDELSAFDQK